MKVKSKLAKIFELTSLENELAELELLKSREFEYYPKEFALDTLYSMDLMQYELVNTESLSVTDRIHLWLKFIVCKDQITTDQNAVLSKQILKLKSRIKGILAKRNVSLDARTLIRSFIQKNFVNRVQEDELRIISTNNFITQERNNSINYVFKQNKERFNPIAGFTYK